MSFLNPWQLLAWIVALELISVPLIIFCVNSIIIGYFKMKEQHSARIAKAGSEALKSLTEGMLEGIAIKKKEDSNEH